MSDFFDVHPIMGRFAYLRKRSDPSTKLDTYARK